ncbi:chymotrypsin-like protease CTRL-1 [Megalobrama amblycephala]|uniref:chymotrypsin-like protease CTRL-1 n=1 Tax=Megalobrama amblycephala TaxID=75352 RepID=UPI00201413B4|nr:chymotrypsin-like protease CTRL-1 [Megalobrama amblycephala]
MKFNTAFAGFILLNIAGSLCQSDVCGQAPLNTKIIGGEDAAAGSWPWQVSIQSNKYPFSGHFCGGSLINKDWVLSAAHCFQKVGASDIWMYFGRWRQSGSNPNETYRTASRIINHPNYEGDVTHNNDIALVQLSSSVNFTDYIKPVCLAAAGSAFAGGTEIWVTGWGNLQTGGPAANILQQVMLPVVNNSECNNAYVGNPSITSNMICAGFLNVGGKSSCQGDSGGPVVRRNGSLWIQSGIVSFGPKQCDNPKYPSVYARVSQYQDWIKSYTGSNPPGFVEFNSSGFRSSLNVLLLSIPFTFSLYLYS